MKKKNWFGVAMLTLMIAITAHAGTWGEGTFENDAARDWLDECADAVGVQVFSQAFDAALRPGYLEADEGAAAIAAAEIIASADGKGPALANPQWAACLDKARTAEASALRPRAWRAVLRVSAPASSELAQLWTAKPNQWTARIDRLAARLAP